MPSTLLQHLTLSKNKETLPLYIKTNKLNDIVVNQKNQIKFKNLLSFDSYFNAFFTNHWLKHTFCRNFVYSLSLQGDIYIKLWKINHKGEKSLFLEKDLQKYTPEKYVEINFEISPKDENSRIYLELISPDYPNNLNNSSNLNKKIKPLYEVRKEQVSVGESAAGTPPTFQIAFSKYQKPLFISGSLYTKEPTKHKVKLGIIICTFKREAYVKNTLKELSSLKSIQANIEIYVIDNGRTLKKSDLKNLRNLHLIPNPNLGGSGGFARGMVEVNKNKTISHVLLMDDDILLDTHIVFKTIQFLQYANQNLAISGSMIDEKRKTYQHESGSNYSALGLFQVSINMSIDLKIDQSLTILSKNFIFDYGAWWYFLFPKEAISKVGLPFPFFFKYDDIEYSIRLKRSSYQLLSIPGIAVWHEPFYMKSQSILKYYATRNSFILNEIHFLNFLYINIASIIIRFLDVISLQDYTGIFLVNKAIEDVLQGPDFFKNIHEESYHQALLNTKNMNIEKIYPPKLKKFNVVLPKFTQLLITKIRVLLILLNYLIPKFLLRKLSTSQKNAILKKKYFYKDRSIYQPLGYREMIFLMPDGSLKSREISHRTFYKLLLRMIILLTKLCFKIPSLKKAWKEAFPYFVSQEAWQKKFK